MDIRNVESIEVALDVVRDILDENDLLKSALHVPSGDVASGEPRDLLRARLYEAAEDAALRVYLSVHEAELRQINPYVRRESAQCMAQQQALEAISGICLAAYKAIIYREVPEHEQFLADIERLVAQYEHAGVRFQRRSPELADESSESIRGMSR